MSWVGSGRSMLQEEISAIAVTTQGGKGARHRGAEGPGEAAGKLNVMYAKYLYFFWVQDTG